MKNILNVNISPFYYLFAIIIISLFHVITIPEISLYAWDSIHANSAGAFLTACVFAAVLFDIHVEKVSGDNRYSRNDAILLAQSAWDFVH